MFLMIIAAITAFFIKGLCGFANTLVFSTFLSFGMNHIYITPVELILGYPSNVLIAWKERKAVNWKIGLTLSILVVLGNIPGIFLLKHTDTRIIKICFGFVIVLIGIEMLLRGKARKNYRQSKAVLTLIGILSGILCGLYGIGALLAAYVSRVTDNSQAFKANICMVFVVENTFRLIVYIMTGIIMPESFKTAVCLMPFMLIGVLAGMRSGRILDEKIVKKIVILMLILSGAALIINNL